MEKKIPNGEVEVYCDFYDKRAFTLYESVPNTANPAGTAPYDMRGKKTRHPNQNSNVGKLWKNDPNVAARYEVAVINSIFKHSEGYVMTRWNDNKDEFHITDIYGTPEAGKHILSNDNDCSDKSSFNIALAYRQAPGGANNGRVVDYLTNQFYDQVSGSRGRWIYG